MDGARNERKNDLVEPDRSAQNELKMFRPAPSLIPPFSRPASRVAIRRVETYQANLGMTLYETLREFNLPVAGKTVLLKPNLVGVDPLGIMNTHPAVIAAARESFLRL